MNTGLKISTTGSTWGSALADLQILQVVATVIVKPLKVNLPEPFESNQEKLWSTFSQVEFIFGFNKDRFVKGQYKVLFTSLYLQGLAFEWFNTFLYDFLKNDPKDRDDDINIIVQNFSHFKKQMRQVIEDFDKKHAAERKMQVLRQTGSAAKYKSKF